MGKKGPRVDAYIVKSADFARPILKRLRSLVHEGCPGVEEDIKWGMPHFNYGGIFCGMAAFKGHCTFGFWNRALRIESKKEGMGQFGRITAPPDPPPLRALLGNVPEAARRAHGRLRRRAPTQPVPQPGPLPASGRFDNYPGETLPH